jgi:hypothetical protein
MKYLVIYMDDDCNHGAAILDQLGDPSTDNPVDWGLHAELEIVAVIAQESNIGRINFEEGDHTIWMGDVETSQSDLLAYQAFEPPVRKAATITESQDIDSDAVGSLKDFNLSDADVGVDERIDESDGD